MLFGSTHETNPLLGRLARAKPNAEARALLAPGKLFSASRMMCKTGNSVLRMDLKTLALLVREDGYAHY